MKRVYIVFQAAVAKSEIGKSVLIKVYSNSAIPSATTANIVQNMM